MDKASLPKRVGIWIRVSTEQQANGDSPENHEARAREYVARMGWHVAEVYRLCGVSGAVSLDHPEATRMLADVEHGRIDALVASKFARIVRDGVQFRLLHRKFKAAKASLISLDENIDTGTPAGELILGIIADLAEWERKEIASRIRASIRPRAQAGKPLGGEAPYGYQWKDRKLVPHPDEAPIRRQIHELYIEYRRKRTVAAALNKRGYRTRKGVPWSQWTIDWLLKDPSAKGLHRKNYIQSNGPNTRWSFKPTDEIIYAPIEPIVPVEVWDKAYAILMARKAEGSRPAKRSDHLFTGVVRCECGRFMYTRDDTHRYICNAKGGCRNRISHLALESALDQVLSDRLTDRAWAERYVADAIKFRHQKEARLRQLEAERTRARETIQKAFELVLQGRMPQRRYQIVCEPHEQRLQEIEEELARLRVEVDTLQTPKLNPESIMKETQCLKQAWAGGSLPKRRAILETHEFEITVTKQNDLDVALHYFPYSEKTVNDPRTLRRPACPFNAGRQLERTSRAPPSLSAAVAHLWR